MATTSSGVADGLGCADGEQAPATEMLAAVERIARAVSVPVTADAEAGYGLPGEELTARVLAAGAVGLNLEDTDHPRKPALVDISYGELIHAGVMRALAEHLRAIPVRPRVSGP